MIPTLFTVSYAGLWGQQALDLPASIRKAGALGYQAVEIMGKRPHLSILDADAGQVALLRETAAESGVAIATVAAYTDFTRGRGTETPFVEIQLAYVRELARLAAALGATVLRVFTGYSTDPNAYREDWDGCVAAIRACAGLAADHGIILGVQNHHDVAVGWESYREFLGEVDHPNCRAMFDPWAPALHGDDLYACANALAPLMVQTTLADYLVLKRYAYQPGLVNYQAQPAMVRAVPLGEGTLDLPAFFRGLKDGGFDGYVAYEMCSPLRGGGSEANLDATATKSLMVMQQLIG
jgi:sugar phosphate isomerase/epimerase